MSKCYICKVEQTLENSKTRLTHSGKTMFKSSCVKCGKRYMHEYSKTYAPKRYKKELQIMENLKINGCAICGYNKCARSLDFHHVNPQNKKFNLSMANLHKKDSLVAEELNKCILVCRNCHGEIHEKERGKLND